MKPSRLSRCWGRLSAAFLMVDGYIMKLSVCVSHADETRRYGRMHVCQVVVRKDRKGPPKRKQLSN